MTIIQIKNFSYRPQDLIYDPLFVVSGPRDHLKAALIAKMSMAKYQVCPIFSNMFSDLPSYPRKQLVLRKTRDIPSYQEQKERSDKYFRQIHSKPHPVQGGDRPKYFSYPIITYPSEVIPYLHFPTFTLKKIPKAGRDRKQKMAGGGMHENIQTDFRDSEMQTSPWQPDYTLINNDGSASPQLLKLDFLKWGSGLPAGKAEVALVERARMKRAWEKHLPPPTDEATLKKRRDIIEAMERDEWAFREQEIQEIQDLRMKLLEEMLAELHQKSRYRSDMKLRNMAEIKKAETDEKIQKLRKQTERELRKLEMKHRGLNPKYHPTDIVEDHAHPKSELYAPLMRHGEHPMRWHQVMDDRLKYYKAQFIGVEEFSTLPKWLNKATILKDDYNTIKLPGTRICMRATKWTTPVLKKLHEELKNLRKTTKRKSTLRVRIEKTISEASTPETSELADTEEDKYQALIAIQSILKGRASQMLIYEGRDKCRELIKELKYSKGLLDEESEVIGKTRKLIKQQQREEALQSNRVAKLQRSLNKLEGSIVGSLLDFLNKELRRLLDERRAHAICFLNERERNDREAAEAGRRQKELRRRREHDEIFKQMVKVHQDTVDMYLEDIITEGMEFASKDEAIFFVKKFMDKIENENAENLERSIDISEQEETIADLVHHFVLPEVQKQMVRQRIKKRQTEKLKRINDTLLDDLIEQIPNMKAGAPDTEDELPSTGFKFQYKTEREIMEQLWGDEEQFTFIEQTVSAEEEGDEDANEYAGLSGFKNMRSSREQIDSERETSYQSTIDDVKSEDTDKEVSKRVEQLMSEPSKISTESLPNEAETHSSLSEPLKKSRESLMDEAETALSQAEPLRKSTESLQDEAVAHPSVPEPLRKSTESLQDEAETHPPLPEPMKKSAESLQDEAEAHPSVPEPLKKSTESLQDEAETHPPLPEPMKKSAESLQDEAEAYPSVPEPLKKSTESLQDEAETHPPLPEPMKKSTEFLQDEAVTHPSLSEHLKKSTESMQDEAETHPSPENVTEYKQQQLISKEIEEIIVEAMKEGEKNEEKYDEKLEGQETFGENIEELENKKEEIETLVQDEKHLNLEDRQSEKLDVNLD